MIHHVPKVLADVDSTAWEFFWRGAGRALYFSPGHMLQPLYSPWIAAEQEAPSQRVLDILKAGITWPTNIVNMKTPAIFEDLIKRRERTRKRPAPSPTASPPRRPWPSTSRPATRW